MDARALLESVSETYRNLKSLEARGTAVTESRDLGFTHSEYPVTFVYAAPNRVRLDPGGRGVLNICDGETLHTYFQEPKRYARHPVVSEHPLPGMFNPAFPYASNSPYFLFQRVTEGVTQAEFLRSETVATEGGEVACDVIVVTYEPPDRRGIAVAGSPFLFWVSAESRLILRSEFEMTVEFPRHGARTSKHILLVTSAAVDQPVDSSNFEFTPPAEAEELPRGGYVGGVGGSSWTAASPRSRAKGVRCSRSHRWDGGSFVEEMQYGFHGHEIKFEQRWTLSEDETEIHITERIQGPKGTMQRELSIPVA